MAYHWKTVLYPLAAGAFNWRLIICGEYVSGHVLVLTTGPSGFQPLIFYPFVRNMETRKLQREKQYEKGSYRKTPF